MRVLIVQADAELARLWAGVIRRSGAEVVVAQSQSEAIRDIQKRDLDVVVLDLKLANGSALAVADFAAWRHPSARIIPVTSRTFFSDGSIFGVIPNACATIGAGTPPDDLAALVDHYGHRS